MEISPFLAHLKDAASNPFALVAYIALIAAWVYVVTAQHRLRTVSQIIRDLPENDRSAIILKEYNTTPRSGLTAEQWIRARRHTLYFLAFLAIIVCATVLIVIAVIRTRPPGPFDEHLRQGEYYLSQKNHNTAETFFQMAQRGKPEDWRPYDGLGRLYFAQRKYGESLANFERSFKLKDEKTDGSLAYRMSTCQDGLGHYEDALRTLETAEQLQEESPLKVDMIYDKGLMNLILWLNGDAPQESKRFRNAELYFRNVLEKGSNPKHWAFYHLACLQATRTQDASLTADKKAKYRTSAIDHLERAVNLLANYQSVKAPRQRKMMRILLGQPEKWNREPEWPVCCPELIKVLKDERDSIDSLINRLNGPNSPLE